MDVPHPGGVLDPTAEEEVGGRFAPKSSREKPCRERETGGY